MNLVTDKWPSVAPRTVLIGSVCWGGLLVALTVVNYSSFVTPELFKLCWAVSSFMAGVTALGLGISCFALIVRLAAMGQVSLWRVQLFMFLPFFICLSLSLFLCESVRLDAAKRTGVKAKILDGALTKFFAANGHVPARLQDLCPKYLPEVPGTGLGAAPKFTYVSSPLYREGQKDQPRYSWVIIVEHPGLGMEAARARFMEHP